MHAGGDQLGTFLASARKVYPNATILKSEQEVADQKASIAERRKKEADAGNEE